MEEREMMEEERESGLVRLCIEAASESKESIEIWRRQRRTLEKMPTPLAEALLRRLLRRRLLYPSLLEVFKHCIEEINLQRENFVDSEWMAYLGAFRNLRTLNIADCKGINNSALWAISGMDCLKDLDLSRCTKVTDAGTLHLISIPNLEKLSVSETSLTVEGVKQLSSLRKLSLLDLGGLPVNDRALRALQELKKLEYLDLWGSKISNNGAGLLKTFVKLRFLNLAWTEVTKVPYLPSLSCLNMSNCSIMSIFEEGYCGVKHPHLARLQLHGVSFTDVHKAFSFIDPSRLSFLDLSNSSLCNFQFLVNMTALEHLDISFSRMEDDSVDLIGRVGATLKFLNFSNTRLRSVGIESLAGFIPIIETLILSHTAVDDFALPYIGMMASLKVLDLSNTNVKGFCHMLGNDQEEILSLIALQNLTRLERLDLEETQVRDGALQPLSCLIHLKFLSLKSDFLTDISLLFLSSFPKLKYLGIRGAVLSSAGIQSFKPPPMLKILDLTDCWLLTEDALLSFRENHPQIEMRHELVHTGSTAQVASGNASPAHGTSRTVQLKPKWVKMSSCPSRFQIENFVDERRKYSREELLELRFSPLSRVSAP
ncbi:Leucine-rich repeat (LRR) family protein [Thalictrum thalictroides]|uniref:Leucine-rich repeat (LRR) family protein n=1 Tax=Thalictrum thalictroides TaxID=46969 RepID=A0A7J6XBJ5_THATH|nr:Leucine-rich repeat (LRR) family protein [Thalictrum thalictroides]